MLEFLPMTIKTALSHVNMRNVYELRLRVDKPISLNYAGKYFYLGNDGVTKFINQAIFCKEEDVSETVYRAGKYSVYSVEEQIKQGFITAEHGERIGLAGSYVFNNGQPLTIRSFTSLCIRVPHEIQGCGQEIYTCCMRDRVHNLLICSSPGLGKTTILRDISRILCRERAENLLICDERGEISEGDIGMTADLIKFSDKKTAFESGIRAMRPDIIVTDELSEYDLPYLERAILAGIKVIASAHFAKISYIPTNFRKIFEKIVVLDKKNIGKIKEIYGNDSEDG